MEERGEGRKRGESAQRLVRGNRATEITMPSRWVVGGSWPGRQPAPPSKYPAAHGARYRSAGHDAGEAPHSAAASV